MRNLFLALCLFIVSINALAKSSGAQKPVKHTIDSLQIQLNNAKEDTTKVKILYGLAVSLNSTNPAEAIIDGKLSLQLAQKLNWEKGCFLAYSALGRAYMVSSDFHLALQNLKKAIEFSHAENDKQLVANNLTWTGSVNFYLADYPQALEYYGLALDMNKKLGNQTLTAYNLNNMGGVYKELADYPKSLECYLQSLKIDKANNDKVQVAIDIGNIGNIYSDMSDNIKAMEYYQKALAMDRDLDNKMAEEANLCNIGDLYETRGEMAKALDYDQKALSLAIQLGDKQGQSMTLGNIGGVFIGLMNYPKALVFLQRALEMNTALDDKNDEADNLDKLSVVYSGLNNNKKAIDFEQKSLKLSKEMGAIDMQAQGYKNLSKIYQKSNEPAEALAAFQQYVILRDSIVNVDKQKEITRKQMQFDFDEKEVKAKAEQDKKDIITKAEIQKDKLERDGFIGGGVFLLLLSGTLFYGYKRNQRQNILLASQKSAIEIRDKEKELLLRELHHRVKNNLQIVSSLLSLQSNQMQDDTSRQAFREGQSRVEAMSLIHQGLYMGDKLSTIEIQEYLQNLVFSVSNSYGYNTKNYELVFDVEKINLDVEIAIPLGLIINEILSNCFKHAFKGIGQPRLEMALRKNGDNIDLTIADNGAGMPAEMHSGKAKTFGMRMINSLTKQIRGNLQIFNKEGSVFEFHFPLDKNTIETANT